MEAAAVLLEGPAPPEGQEAVAEEKVRALGAPGVGAGIQGGGVRQVLPDVLGEVVVG